MKLYVDDSFNQVIWKRYDLHALTFAFKVERRTRHDFRAIITTYTEHPKYRVFVIPSSYQKMSALIIQSVSNINRFATPFVRENSAKSNNTKIKKRSQHYRLPSSSSTSRPQTMTIWTHVNHLPCQCNESISIPSISLTDLSALSARALVVAQQPSRRTFIASIKAKTPNVCSFLNIALCTLLEHTHTHAQSQTYMYKYSPSCLNLCVLTNVCMYMYKR